MAETMKRRSIPACCDIFEKDGNILLTLEMPGVKKDGLDISVDGDELTISGRRMITVNDRGKYLAREIKDTDYFQKYTIDNTIDRDKIDAILKNGILTVTLHVKESEKPRQITVKGD